MMFEEKESDIGKEMGEREGKKDEKFTLKILKINDTVLYFSH